MDTFLLPDGYFGPYDQNEVQIVSDVSDPPKLRLGVVASALNGDDFNIGTVSGNLVRGDGRHEEYAELKFALAPNRQGGAVRVQVRREGLQFTEEVLYIDSHGITASVPIHAPNLGTTGFPRRIALRAVANGRIVCAEAQGNQPLIANRTEVGPWETFDVIQVS